MTEGARTNLYVLFDGARGARKPVSASTRAPRSGIKVRVAVEGDALERGQVHLLVRKGYGDLVLAASSRADVVEEARRKLGSVSREYVIETVPVLRRDTSHVA